MRLSRYFISTFILLVATSGVAHAQEFEPIVRVHVLSRVAPQNLTVSAADGELRLYANREDHEILTLAVGESTRIERVGDRIRLNTPTAAIQAEVIEVVPPRSSISDIRTGSHHRQYYGALSIEVDDRRRALRLVNYVPLEDYVASVVASEYPFPELEGVKAQAVLARTYALRSRDPGDPFDLVDDTRAQVYEGALKETSITREAANDTRGEVLSYRGNLAEALYYSSSGGHTASNEDIWHTRPIPYLRGRPDPYDSAAPDHRWSTSASVSRLNSALSRRYPGTVYGVEIDRRSRNGYVTSVRLHGSSQGTITGAQFRSVVNATFGSRILRSTNFRISKGGTHYTFTGRGFGHGVGMSQYGARGQALQGRSYKDILNYYFAGTSVDYLDTSYGELPQYAGRRGSSEQATNPIIRQVADHQTPNWSGAPESESTPRRTAW